MELIRKTILQLRDHKNLMQFAAVIALVIIALVLFGVNGQSQTITVDESSASELAAEAPEHPEEEAALPDSVFVDVGGEVSDPGVYEVKGDARIFEVIEKAGGLTKDADTTMINQAETVSDGMKITIPSKQQAVSAVAPEQGGTGDATVTQTETEGGKININTADSTALQEIPGVGPATAEKIISYRNEQGAFQSIEDLKNVSGIGDKTFMKMKDRITI